MTIIATFLQKYSTAAPNMASILHQRGIHLPTRCDSESTMDLIGSGSAANSTDEYSCCDSNMHSVKNVVESMDIDIPQQETLSTLQKREIL